MIRTYVACGIGILLMGGSCVKTKETMESRSAADNGVRDVALPAKAASEDFVAIRMTVSRIAGHRRTPSSERVLRISLPTDVPPRKIRKEPELSSAVQHRLRSGGLFHGRFLSIREVSFASLRAGILWSMGSIEAGTIRCTTTLCWGARRFMTCVRLTNAAPSRGRVLVTSRVRVRGSCSSCAEVFQLFSKEEQGSSTESLGEIAE